MAVARADQQVSTQWREHPESLGSHRLPATRAIGALALANARYWWTVAPQVRRHLRHWEARAEAIEDPDLRALALEKLRAEGFNAEAAAMAATIAPRAGRGHAVQAIVALELLFDYLDGLTERPHEDPLGEGERQYAAFTGALDPDAEHPRPGGGYLQELAHAVGAAIAQLPSSDAIAQVAQRCAARGAQAQIRMHATPLLGTAQLGEWARIEAQDSAFQWREFLAGAASSVLALHALIAAAADPLTTPAEAEQIDAAYLSIGVIVTLLDGLIDRDNDAEAGTLSYVALYEDPALLTHALAYAAREASHRSGELRNSAHHVMTLAGAVAYWCSAPGARGEFARPVLADLRRELQPLVFVPLLLMRAWRASKSARIRGRGAATAKKASEC
jgi:tetraprenyl-beta-curcumene synthase